MSDQMNAPGNSIQQNIVFVTILTTLLEKFSCYCFHFCASAFIPRTNSCQISQTGRDKLVLTVLSRVSHCSSSFWSDKLNLFLDESCYDLTFSPVEFRSLVVSALSGFQLISSQLHRDIFRLPRSFPHSPSLRSTFNSACLRSGTLSCC